MIIGKYFPPAVDMSLTCFTTRDSIVCPWLWWRTEFLTSRRILVLVLDEMFWTALSFLQPLTHFLKSLLEVEEDSLRVSSFV